MTTAGDLINLSLKDAGIIGVGQTALAEDSNSALTRMNWMIDQWARKRWLVYHLIDLGITSTGATTYTIGPSGDMNMSVRPDRLEAAFMRQISVSPPNQIDYPLEILEAREDYNNIALKQLQSFPEYVFYDAAWPLGVVYPWPVLQPTIYALHVTVKDVLAEIASLSSVINLPGEYFAALNTNLAVILRDAYDLPPKPVLIERAKMALNVLRGANAQIGRLTMPPGLMKSGVYDFFSDRIRGN